MVAGAGMALAQDEAIALGPVRAGRSNFEIRKKRTRRISTSESEPPVWPTCMTTVLMIVQANGESV